jgi:dihydroorotate dehydrogenase (fumarate)
MTSGVLRNGPGYLGVVLEELERWMRDNEYVSVDQMLGSMSLQRCPDPQAFERANYMKVLQSWDHPRPL